MFYILAGAVEICCSCVYGCFLPTAQSVLKSHNSRHTQSLHCNTAHEIYESHKCCGSEVTPSLPRTNCVLFCLPVSTDTPLSFAKPLTDQHSTSLHWLVLSVHVVVEFMAEVGVYTHCCTVCSSFTSACFDT